MLMENEFTSIISSLILAADSWEKYSLFNQGIRATNLFYIMPCDYLCTDIACETDRLAHHSS